MSDLDSELGSAGGHRQARLQHLIHEELSTLLRDDVGDPLLRGLPVVIIELSVDYRHVRVGVTAPVGQTRAPATPAGSSTARTRRPPGSWEGTEADLR